MDPDLPTRPLGFLVGDIARLLRRRFEKALAEADTGLTAGEARTLAFVEHYPDQRQSALAERFGVEPMTMCGFLDRLENAGLVARRPDPSDRRAKLVALTAAAEPVLDRIHAEAVTIRRAALAGMNRQEMDAVYALLERMHTNLHASTDHKTYQKTDQPERS
ncbi:MarR family winged helix-turn-helix transcriptional regulator [Stappia indica]|uniref:MarR family transcriptional regulator n=1 Tax=Stappia indica TaxID=538381 RepID=A0A857C8G4_9HYPH|nr:MarR family transcriptional regulator [Stappia indica]QGZ35158.1 MarR family transcriptional regulator [Stappia indica]